MTNLFFVRDLPYLLVASSELSPAEALLQTFDNLEQLSTAINDIFDRLSDRVRSSNPISYAFLRIQSIAFPV